MRSLSRKNRPGGHTGLDIAGSYIAASQVSGGAVLRAASADLEPGVISEGEVADGDRLAHAIRDLFRGEAFSRRVRIGVANPQIVVRHIEMPRIPDERERDAAVRFQVAEAVAMPLDEAVVDYQVVAEGESPDGSAQMRILVVAARRSMVMAFVNAVRDAGLKPENIDLNAFALLRALQTPRDDEATRVYCHLGSVVNVAVGVKGTCLFTRLLATACDGREGVESLAEEVRLSVEYYRARGEAPALEELVLSGPGAATDGVASTLEARLGLPATVAAPLGALPTTGLPPGDDPYRYTLAAGLAMEVAA